MNGNIFCVSFECAVRNCTLDGEEKRPRNHTLFLALCREPSSRGNAARPVADDRRPHGVCRSNTVATTYLRIAALLFGLIAKFSLKVLRRDRR